MRHEQMKPSWCVHASALMALTCVWLSACNEQPTEPEEICQADFPCFDQKGVCAGDRQIRVMESRDCHAVCGPGPCQGAVCVPTTIRDCRSDEVCVMRKLASGTTNAECAACDDDDAGMPQKPSTAGGVCGGTRGCGDGQGSTRFAREECDDGNRLGGDGCSADCTIEPGWDCYTPGAPCHKSGAANPECSSQACRRGARCREPSGLACACPTAVTLLECEPIAIETLGVIEGTDRVFPSAISRDGSTVVGYASHSVNADARALRAVAWTAERGLFSLGFPTDRDSRAVAANGDGSVLLVLAEHDTSDYDSYLWTAEAKTRLQLPAGGVANDLSDDGEIVVGSLRAEAGVNDIFRWTPRAGVENLGDLGLWSSSEPAYDTGAQAEGLSADGNVVVGVSGGHAFRWTRADGMQRLPAEQAADTSADGAIVLARATNPVDSRSNSLFAMRWSVAGGVEWLGSLPSSSPGNVQSFYEAMALSADGSVVVGTLLREGQQIPWIWEQTRGMRALADVLSESGVDVTGWDLRTLSDISGDGKTIVGAGGLAGRQAAFIVRLP